MRWSVNRDIEATRCEYKLSLESEKPKSWLKSVSAFANGKGGHILFGYTDDTHKPKGLLDAQTTASKIAELIGGRISPAPRYELEAIKDGMDSVCIDLDIKSGPAYPYYYVHEGTKEAFVRHGDQSVKATDIELNNLILKGQNRTFDSLPTSKKISDVSFTFLCATFKNVTGDDLILPRDLISMGLLNEEGQVTNAGLLLSDQGALKQSKIVCTRWKGRTKGAVDGDALDDQEYSDSCLITLLNNAESFVRNNSRKPWTIRGMHREENSDYPFRAVREVLVNALIHRDYQIVGTEVHVDIFDDRLEIVSPGGMMNGSRIQDLDLRHVPSIRRNEVVSDVFSRLHFMERRGSGIGRILNSYSGFCEQPVFESNEFFFTVSLPNRGVATPAQMELPLDKNTTFEEKAQLSPEKTQLSPEKTQLLDAERQFSSVTEDWELKYFHDVIVKKLEEIFRGRTLVKIEELFARYRYTYSFNRSNVAELFGVTENRASGILKTCVDKGIIIKHKNGVYYFVKQ